MGIDTLEQAYNAWLAATRTLETLEHSPHASMLSIERAKVRETLAFDHYQAILFGFFENDRTTPNETPQNHNRNPNER